MDQNEVMFPESEITVQPGLVIFNSYEAIKDQAVILAEKIKTVEVTEENVKQSKKLLAAVNRKVKELEDGRIAVKKMLLEPYQLLEDQVKEIVAIVKDADAFVRDQVRELEEAERAEKHTILEDLFNKRMIHYSFRNLFTFQHFLKPRHLNKTASIESVEKEMVDFLEKLARDFNAIGKMADADAILVAYQDHLDLAAAITQVEALKEKQQAVKDAQVKTSPKISYLVSIRCQDQKELKLLELILKENDFLYSIDHIN